MTEYDRGALPGGQMCKRTSQAVPVVHGSELAEPGGLRNVGMRECLVPGSVEGLNSRGAGCSDEVVTAVQGFVLDRRDESELAV